MVKIRMLKYTKHYMAMILLSIGLLYVQAVYCDLALPNYLSNIVNVGIQQGGVANAVPVAMNQTEMNRSLIFIEPANHSYVLGNYTLVKNDSSTTAYQGNISKYPALANIPVYVLNNVNSDVITQLNPVMGQAILVVSTIEAALANQTLAAQLKVGNNSLAQIIQIIPPGWDFFTFIQTTLNASSLALLNNQITASFAALGTNFIVQAATVPIKRNILPLAWTRTRYRCDYMQALVVLCFYLHCSRWCSP